MNTTFKGTPGPWKVDREFIHHQDNVYCQIVGGCGYLGEDKIGLGFTGCISTADAALIAAAPEMLEVLMNRPQQLDGMGVYQDWEDKVKAIITKALNP